ncbi:ribosomal protection-like ABC-F family protein [Petrotoga sp. 9PWA.NaAc.5.4]|uniref:ribosomal protection-like ABC-F family protein n=1 Tax=Petrotoga sp. 9PWA.NaAc.5.4 TaxID=1434328 RepID=UPI000CA8B33E|nr:ABC-F family ATP-binding cassette domain-containing protein [Petrotoga sp. 9PWA.NaAc.5.4]PNR95936.1 ABC transporter [Petrotoga sp. 9PWA.NaAc.5.4]
MILRLDNVSHNYGDFFLFYDVNLEINSMDKIGLIGKNGSGKTTLLKIIMGEIEPIEGEVIRKNNLDISLLTQYRTTNADISLYEFLKEGVSKNLEDYIVDKSVRNILVGLGFSEDQWKRKVSTLSGGELTRLSLGRVLAVEHELLLLDEPTNHLDLYSIEWLIKYLKNYKGALVVISHDRAFLEQICGKYWEINNSKVWEFKGSFGEYLKLREIYINSVNTRKENLQKEITRLEKMIQRYRIWGTEKMVRQAVLRERKLDELKAELEEIENIEDGKPIKINIPQPEKTGYKILEVDSLSFSYHKNQNLLKDISFKVFEGEKIAILGKNGSGKSTLLKILIGEVKNYSGKVKWGHNIKIGYLDQVILNLFQDSDILSETWNLVKDWKDFEVRKYLGRFGFYGEEVFKKINELSGGELTRLALAKILLEKPNVLILDEPTNHLDILTIETLENTLKEYKGAMIFVSHDEYFIKNIADKYVLIEDGFCEIDEDFDNIIDSIKNSSFKIKKYKKKNIDYEKNKRAKNRIKSLKLQLSDIRKRADILFKDLDFIETKLFKVGDDYNKVMELMEEKGKKEKELLNLEILEEELVKELYSLENGE